MEKITLKTIFKIAEERNIPIFKSYSKYNYNLNIWGFRSNEKDTTKFNDLCAVFYESRFGDWFVDWFVITTDPSNLTLMKPVNSDGTAILCEGHHSKLWMFGNHKQRRDHKALVQHAPCKVYRDNNKDSKIDSNLPIDFGLFGINMHRASNYGVTPSIGLYSAGCQVHADVDRYNNKFIPLVEASVAEGNKLFSYTLILEDWMKV
jgi:hypothetical protein